MSSISSRKLFLASILSAFVLQLSATPVASPLSQNVKDALSERATLPVQQTTTTDHHTIDWVHPESQGQGRPIAKPPVPLAVLVSNLTTAVPELQKPGAQLGPPGTVPIPRVDPLYLNNVATKALPDKKPPGHKSKRQNSNVHWYVSSTQTVANIGGSAAFSLFKAFVANIYDFSLLQTAVTHSSSNGIQTLEAGWINYPCK